MNKKQVWISFLFYLLFALVGLSAISLIISFFAPDFDFMNLPEIAVASVIVAFFSTWGKIFRAQAYQRGKPKDPNDD